MREKKDRKQRRRKEKRIERKWHPVKLKKMGRWTELNLSVTPREMKGGFDKIFSFHLSSLLSSHVFNALRCYLTLTLLSSSYFRIHLFIASIFVYV